MRSDAISALKIFQLLLWAPLLVYAACWIGPRMIFVPGFCVVAASVGCFSLFLYSVALVINFLELNDC